MAKLNNERIKAFIPTRDAAKSKDFYGNILGLILICEDDFGMEFDANGTRLRIANVPEYSPYPFTSLGWVVGDVVSKVVELQSNGIVFERYPYFVQDELGIWTSPDGIKVAWFKDPDGNLLSLND